MVVAGRTASDLLWALPLLSCGSSTERGTFPEVMELREHPTKMASDQHWWAAGGQVKTPATSADVGGHSGLHRRTTHRLARCLARC
jgi:hypothetical protein